MYGKSAPYGTTASFSGSVICAHTETITCSSTNRTTFTWRQGRKGIQNQVSMFLIKFQQPVIITHVNTETTVHYQGIHQHIHMTVQKIRSNEHSSFRITQHLMMATHTKTYSRKLLENVHKF
jgi:hypothetical protein